MIPLRDNVPRVRPPWAVIVIVALNTLAYGWEMSLSRSELVECLYRFGVVPLRYTDTAWACSMGYPGDGVWPFLTYMFLHSGLLHLVFNMWFLWIFADNVEDACGHWRFLTFYLLCGFLALGTHLVFHPGDSTPIVGASGAIAGVMGAYFMLYPQGTVLTFIPVLIFPWFLKLSAVFFLGLWFGLQVVFGLGTTSGDNGGIAWWAHAGGFAAGILLIRVFRNPSLCESCYLTGLRGDE